LKRLLRYSLLVVSALGMTQRLQAQAGGPTRPEPSLLTVCLVNDAGLTDDEVTKVEGGVDQLFGGAGIAIRWIRGGDPGRTVEEKWACEHPESWQRVMVRWMKSGLVTSPNELAEAFLDGSGRGVITDVFLDKVERVKGERGVDFDMLLAHITAHEIGHLLLGGEPHSMSGLMQAKVSEQSLTRMMQGNLSFSRAEQKKMHARVATAEMSALLARNQAEKWGK